MAMIAPSQQSLARWFLVLFTTAMVCAFVACGAGSAGTPRMRPTTLTGYVIDGPIANATVQIFSFTDGSKGALLGTTTSDQYGGFTANIRRATDGPMLIEAVSGIYRDDFSPENTPIQLTSQDTSDQKLRAVILFNAASTASISVTPYTTLATGLAEYYISQQVSVTDAIHSANGALNHLLGNHIDILRTRPANIASAEAGVTEFTPEVAYGLFTGALSAYAKNISDMSNAQPYSSFTAIGLTQVMYADLRADGILDGQTRFINGEPGALYYGQALSGTDYRHEIGVGAFRIADTRARGGVTPSAMSAMINAARLFAESNDPLFGDAAAAPFDDQAPVFTDDTLEFVGYNREKKYVEYRISVRDNIAVQRIAVSVDVRAGEFKPAYIENILPGNLIRLYVGDVGPGTHQLLVDAMDVVGNSATKIYSVALPDGKPLLVLDTPRITKEASFRIGGRYIDEGGSGIKSIAITQNARTYTATLDSTASTWYADLTLASGTNTLSVRITDNQGLFRDVAYAIVVDDTPPDVTVAYSNAEFYRNGQVIAGKLGSASATSDPLYVPTARVGYANPAADAATLANNSIPFYSLRVSDNISAPTDIKVRFQYRLNDIIKAPYRSILATANDPALYTLPLIRELLSDDWYQANPGDVHTLDIEFTDTVGNVNTRSYQFKAFFGVPRLGINSRVRFAHVEVYTYVNGAKGGRVGACDTDAGGQCDIRVLADSQFLYAELHNGRYAEPATQTDLPLIASDTLTGLADFKGRDLTVVISPFTHLAMGLIDYAIENGVSLSSAYTQTITDLTAVYNFDVMTTVPADPQALAFSDTPPSNATRYALLLAGLSEWASNFTPASSSVTAAQAFYRDARADGLLDGFGLDAQQGRSALSFGGHTLDANDYRFQLANNALAYIKKHYTLSAPAMQAVVQNLQAWAANTHPRFGNLTPLTLNTQLPVVSVLSATLTTAANYPMRVNVTPGTVAVGAVRVGTTAATLVANTTEWNATSRLNTQGKNTLTIRVYDIANNELLTKNVDITLDNLGPDVVVTQPTGINNSTVTVADLSLTGTAADATGLDYLNLQLGTQVTRANASPWTAKFKLAPGTNTLALEARDTLGNLTTQTLTVYYSVPGPIVTFNPYSTRSANTKPQFSGTVNPLGMTFTMNATLFVQAASGWVQKATLAVVPNNANAWTLDLFTGSALTLATGNYKLSIVAQNSQKNSTITDTLFSVDTVGPNLRLLSAANTRVNPYTLNLEVIDAEGGSIVSVTVDGVNATSASNNQWTYAVPRVPSDGMRAHTVVAKDDLGNTSTQVFNVTLDTVVPLISMTDPILPAGPTQRLWRNTKNATLSYSVSDTTAPLTSGVQVNGGIVLAEGPHAQSVNVQIPLSQEGANTVRINATDGVGNTAFKEFIVYRDTLAPQLSSVTAPPSVVATAKANFVVDVIEANLSSFSVAMSAAGATPISGEIVLDVNVGTTVTTSVGTLTYTAATGRLSGSIGLGSGTNTLVIKASDAAGNVSNVITFNTRLDTTAPSISVTGLNAQTNAVVTASATLSGTLNDDTYPVNVSGKYQTLNNQCQLSAVTPFAIGSVSTSSQLWSTTLPAQGTYQLTLTATDNVNNSTDKTLNVLYDNTAPTVTLGAATTTLKTTSVNFNITEANLESITVVNTVSGVSASVSASLNCAGATQTTLSASNATGAYSFNLNTNLGTATLPLSPGDNAISVVVTDKSGKSTTSNTVIAAIETLPPTATIANSGTLIGDTIVTTQSALSIAASDTNTGNSGIQSVIFYGGGNTTARTVTSGASGVYTDPYRQTTDGSYTYTVEVFDGVGNKTTLLPLLVRDTSAPTVNIVSPKDESSTQSAILPFTVDISDGNPLPNPVTVTVKVGTTIVATHDIPNFGFANAITRYAFDVGLLNGDNRYDVTTLDAYNKISAVASVNVTRNRDTSSPTVVITSNPVTPTKVANLTLFGTATDANPGTVVMVNKNNAGTVLSTSAAVSYATFSTFGIDVILSEGDNNLSATATDTQGNSRTSSSLRVNLDTLAPTVTLPAATTVGATSVSGTLTDVNLPTSITVNAATYPVSSSGKFTVTGLTTGVSNSLTITATDRAGNTFGPSVFMVNALP